MTATTFNGEPVVENLMQTKKSWIGTSSPRGSAKGHCTQYHHCQEEKC